MHWKKQTDDLETELISSSLFIAPATSTDSFVDQLDNVVTAILDKFASFKIIAHRAGGKPINCFLSQNAKEGKRKRRRLERCWKRTSEESDHCAYRSQC